MSETKFTRRAFVRGVVGLALAAPMASSVAASVAVSRTKSGTLAPLDEIDDNYWAFAQEIKRLVLQGYDVEFCSLEAEADGYRRVTVRFRNEPPQSWHQPWTRQRHWEANVHRNFAECDCGAQSLTPHAPDCRHTTHLAHRLGPDLEGYKVA